jgi:hypothetical protein
MSVLAQRLWREPAVFVTFLVGVLNVAQVFVVDNETVSAAIVAASLALGAHQIRSRVSPNGES